jgi:hypothetical protein
MEAEHLPSVHEALHFPSATKKRETIAGHQWLTPVILSTKRSGGSRFKASWANSSRDPISKNSSHTYE